MSSISNVASLLFSREVLSNGTSSVRNREKGIQDWVTSEASRHFYSECCVLNNTPRSTIAATINKEGTLIASTHGDHTVKLVNFQTGEFVKELSGHRRTPWTVKFHPLRSNLLVSGSLDFEIKLWDTDLGICLQSKDFGRQISSISFHPTGKALAICAGHKLHLWEFDEIEGRFGRSSCIFRTTKTIRTVHFSPRGDSILVSERVEPPSFPPEVLRPAPRSTEYLPPVMQPPQHAAWNDIPRDPWLRGVPGMPNAHRGNGPMLTLRDHSQGTPPDPIPTGQGYSFFSAAASEIRSSDAILRQLRAIALPPVLNSDSLDILPVTQRAGPSFDSLNEIQDQHRLQAQQPGPSRIRSSNPRQLHLVNPSQTMPVLSLMPMNHSSAELTRPPPQVDAVRGPQIVWNQQSTTNVPIAPASGNNDQPHVTKLVLYEFDVENPHETLNKERMKIENAVVCSEMGTHISSDGRLLVVCVATPAMDRHNPGQPGFHYELRVISLEKQNFGQQIRTRTISAGHCLTSVQFSPGSDMILLSYGRKHASLLRCLEMNGAPVAQIHTLLELYSSKTLTLVRVMHSAEDEANTASFHPYAGEGIVYGTKNGKLRILRHKRSNSNGDGGEIKDYENELLEVLEDELE